MMQYTRRLRRIALTQLFSAAIVMAQVPTGGLGGVISDGTDAVVQNAQITVSSPDSGMRRTATSGADGSYAVSGLPAGTYAVSTTATGFQTVIQIATVRAGADTRVSMRLSVGPVDQSIEVRTEAPPLNYERHGISGGVSRFQIVNLPLNGREFLQLATLEPGISAAPSAGFFTRRVDIAILGGTPEQTRVTMDGGPIYGPVAGGTPQNFSQEVVQEFQVSSANFDLSTGLTSAGAVNVATRYGGNSFHGSGFSYFRDHNMAAYPALRREQANADPFFARRQSGFNLGGPIKKNRAYFFTTAEHLNQDGVVTVQPRVTELATFGGIFPSRLTGNQATARIDLRINDSHNLFVRYSHDGNDGFAPPAGQASLPSNWSRNQNWSDQSLLSFTSALTHRLTNEIRVSYWYWHTRNLTPTTNDCSACPGLGMPEIHILGTDFAAGNYTLAPQGGDFRRYHLADNLTWQVGSHQFRLGGEWQFDRGNGFLSLVEPASLVLYSPQAVRAYNADPSVLPQARIPLPSVFRTFNDLLQLPLAAVNIGFGDASQPPSFAFESARKDHIARIYWQDRWRVTPRLSMNYGLAYHLQARLANHDLSKPEYLAPLLGARGLSATANDRNNFAPSAGLVWTPTRDLKTVLRIGAGMYYDLPLASQRLQERSTLGPRGTGRVVVDGSLIQNPIPGIPTVPLGRPLNFRTSPTQLTGSHLLSILPNVRRTLVQQFGDPTNTDLSIRNIDVFKQGAGIIASDFVSPYSLHFNVGVQRELARDLVVTADFVLRRSVHQNTGGIDLNRWNSASGPVIPRCAGQQALDPRVRCSTGPVEVQFSAGRSRYQALLLKLDRRWSRRYQVSLAYALASSVGLEQVISNDNWFAGYGPADADRRHTLTVSGIVDLPFGLRLSSITSFASKTPFRAQLFGVDLNGDGKSNDLLPGTGWNELNRGLGTEDLRARVGTFNATLAGGRTPTGQLIPSVTLPSSLSFGDRFFSMDFRLAKVVHFGERYEINVFAEVFNALNVANLSGYGTNLLEPSSFAQPASRVTQVFGSGGPRAFQLGGRFNF